MCADERKKGTNMQYRVVFSDIDGTLLNSKHQVTPDTRLEILSLEQRGIPFILVSARMPDGILTIQNQIGNHAPIICYSGALICGTNGEILYSCQMNLDFAVEVKNMLDKEFPNICCNTYGHNKWIVDDDKNLWVRNEETITGIKSKIGNIEEAFAENAGIHKFLLMGDPKDILILEKRLKQDYPNLHVAKSTEYYLEVMEERVRKSKAVRILCDHYGYSMDEAIVFGDGHNDIDMLKDVKNSYAMANAPKEVQDSAAYVTLDNDHEGLLVVLKKCFES